MLALVAGGAFLAGRESVDGGDSAARAARLTVTGASDPPGRPAPTAARGSKRVLSLPRVGTVTWRCDSRADPSRFSVSLGVPIRESTLTGTVAVGNDDPMRFRVDPGQRVDTSFSPATTQVWTISSRHKPVELTVGMTLRFENINLCIVQGLSVQQTGDSHP